jgi:diguanylate cyclase (GGDEF)-like protein
MIKILVIDDDTSTRLVIRKILTTKNKSVEIIEAEDGKRGVKLALENRPDLIICDVIMPEFDGYSVLTQIRKNKNTATIPFIFLTSKNDFSDLRKGMNLGADDYLIKPFEPKDLIDAVKTRLHRFALVNKYYTEQIQQIQQQLQTEEQLTNTLNHDPLTNLPNRFALRSQFNQIKEKWYHHSSQIIPIIYIKIDQFDQIINEHGYAISDLLVKDIGNRLVNFIGQDNTIAHVSIDEFVVILAPVDSEEVIRVIVTSLLEELAHSFTINNKQITVKTLGGIANYPRDGKELDILLQNSKATLLQIKNQSNYNPADNQYAFYSPIIDLKNQEKNKLQQELQGALQKRQFRVNYQGKINLKTAKIEDAEALIRWVHPELGTISPIKFIPIAEELGLIEEIGYWLLDQVCQDLNKLHTGGFPDFNIAINVSGKQLNQINFHKKLVQTLLNYNLSANCIGLEITEDLLLQDDPVTLGKLNALHDIGVKIALDDFGTGYSSLNYLKTFPINIIKIDKCLIRNIDLDDKNTVITQAIIDLAHRLNLIVIAEGVETKTELNCLKSMNCDFAQGYAFSLPLPFNDFFKLLKNQQISVN